MNTNPDDLQGLSSAEAKEYLLQFITTLKLTEKDIGETEKELTKWKNRVELARSKGTPELTAEAEKVCAELETRKQTLSDEAEELKGHIEKIRRRIPGLAARERSVDPELLEQELLMAAGYNPGDGDSAAAERQLKDLEKDAAAETALDELKRRMK